MRPLGECPLSNKPIHLHSSFLSLRIKLSNHRSVKKLKKKKENKFTLLETQ